MNSYKSVELSDMSLLRETCRIGDAWCGSDSCDFAEVFDPANGARVGRVPDMGVAETRRAIKAAERALPTH